MLSPVRLSVCHTGGSYKNGWSHDHEFFHRTVAHIPLVFREQFYPEIMRGSPKAGALNEGGLGKIGDFRNLSRHISETVQDRTKVDIDH